MDDQKVYLTRDEGSDKIWLWKKPIKGNWSPQKLQDCDIVCYQRQDINNADCYFVSDFKKKFGITIKQKIKKCCHLSKKIINNEDYKLFSNDKNRKK